MRRIDKSKNLKVRLNRVSHLCKKHDATTADEYLSGLPREDRLSPVITLVIN